MASAVSDTGAAYSEIVLKTTPPRAPRHQLARPRLSLDDERFRDCPVIVVQAPAGFGKTSLLAQWRRENLARGAAVAWLSADERDEPQRFLHSLVLAVRTGCARPSFGRFLLEGAAASAGELEGITGWLAEVAQTSLDLVLIVDEADRLPPSNASALIYLLHNVPPNLRVVVATRGGLDAAVADLVAYGQCVAVGAEMLRFRVDETIALVFERFGAKVDADTCARLQDLTDGWPLGLQLALTAIEQGGDPRSAISAIYAPSGQGGEQLLGRLIARLAPDDADFLTRIAVVDLVHPDLARALTGLDEAPERLARLARDTPIFLVNDDSEWCRLHTLARDTLRQRLADLPAAELVALHTRAMDWLADHGMIQEAARHALAAGRRATAYDLAEQCLYEEAMAKGHQETVLEWLDLLPAEELDCRPRLRLAVAWALALSERHEEAGRLVARILEAPDADATLRYECSLIASGAAYYADEPDRCVSLLAPWTEAPPERDPRLLQMHANRLGMISILQGDPARARFQQQAAHRGASGDTQSYAAARVGDFVIGLSYLWEGQMLLAEEVLRPSLASADADLGRRHPLSCMLASLLAAALYERDCLEDAAALLANRLDILERVGPPESALFGYRTAARLAAARGMEHRALDLLEALYVIGESRRLPRLGVASLAEQVRMHAGRSRSETCRALTRRIDDVLDRADLPQGSLWRRSVEWMQVMAHVNVAISAGDWDAALEAMARAGGLAETLKLGRVGIEIMALRAFVLDRKGEEGRPLLQEAMNLAHTYGLVRTFGDAHPALADWARRVAEEEPGGRGATTMPLARIGRPSVERSAVGPRAVPSMVLTPKERDVLELLARSLSNKEIAQAMAVGEETVKWHLKNLFGKLDAGTRKHAVRRAQLLGLLEGVE